MRSKVPVSFYLPLARQTTCIDFSATLRRMALISWPDLSSLTLQRRKIKRLYLPSKSCAGDTCASFHVVAAKTILQHDTQLTYIQKHPLRNAKQFIAQQKELRCATKHAPLRNKTHSLEQGKNYYFDRIPHPLLR